MAKMRRGRRNERIKIWMGSKSHNLTHFNCNYHIFEQGELVSSNPSDLLKQQILCSTLVELKFQAVKDTRSLSSSLSNHCSIRLVG
jgi:hypothetical protein